MALSADVRTVRYGTPGNSTQYVNQPLKASSTVYRGSVAITRSGYVVAASAPSVATDIVWGIVENGGPGYANTGPGIVGGSADGDVTVEIATGSFYLASGTGSDALTQADVGATVYLLNETTVAKTDGGSSLPIAGKMVAYDASQVDALGPIVVHLGSNQSSGAPS